LALARVLGIDCLPTPSPAALCPLRLRAPGGNSKPIARDRRVPAGPMSMQ